MAELSVQQTGLTGLSPVFSAADVGGDTFVNDGRTVLYVQNGGAVDTTVTVDSPTPCNYGYEHDVQVTVPAGEERVIGPFRQDRFNDDNGRAAVAYSEVTLVTVAALSL